MQITSLLSRREDGGPSHDQDNHYDHTPARLYLTLIGLCFIVNSFLVTLLVDQRIGDLSAMIGAVLLGLPIVATAIKDLNRGRLSTNELVAIAVSASFAGGDYQEAGVIAFLMLLGEIIETRTAEGARKSLESLIKLTPTQARCLRNGKEVEVDVADLKVGDVIRVRPGDNIPADGVVISGQGSFNQANVTGESLPVDKNVDDEVFAGTQNLTGVLEIKVSRAGEDTTLGRVRELILAAEQTRLPIMRIVDRYMGFYTPLVILIAVLVWLFTEDMSRVIAIFIISCPCAFILATPTAMVAALSAAARLGILIKNVGDLELSARINSFIFDKTGTLTTGQLFVGRLFPAEGVKPAELLRLAASAEKYSNHPAAKALAELAEETGVTLTEPEDFHETAGQGVKAKVGEAQVVVGRARWLSDNGVGDSFTDTVEPSEVENFSLLYVARDGQFVGWVGLQDRTRPEARESLDALAQTGVRRIAMVSGDRKTVASRVAQEIGCEEVLAECLPQHKVDFVRKMKAKGYQVAVVGDGVNDAPALAAGDLGIAMGAAGSEVAIHSATIALMNNDLRRLPFLVRLSRMTRLVINQNFLFGALFVISGMILAAMKIINPVLAATLHVIGSLLVVFNSFRLVRQGEELEPFLPEARNEPAPKPEPAGDLKPESA